MKLVARLVLIAVTLVAVLFVLLRDYCPKFGFALNKQRSDFHQLKNRLALPQQSDFNSLVTLERLLQPTDDRSRWSTSRAAQVEGYVVSVESGPLEAANCYCRRDMHIMIAPRLDAAPREQVVLEVTPRIKATKQAQTLDLRVASPDAQAPNVDSLKDWSLETVKRDLTGRRVRFEGWLFFDSSHAAESENTAPGRANNWRATAWELHPVTKIEILK
jgi:hypothetical protein